MALGGAFSQPLKAVEDHSLTISSIEQEQTKISHQAVALVNPQAVFFIACICGLERQQALPSSQAIIITHHPDD